MLLWSLWFANLQRKVFHCIVYCVHLAPLAHFSIPLSLSLSLILFTLGRINYNLFEFSFSILLASTLLIAIKNLLFMIVVCEPPWITYIWQLTFFCCYVPKAFKRLAPLIVFMHSIVPRFCFMTVPSKCVGKRCTIERQAA